jgi:hypothetical protein
MARISFHSHPALMSVRDPSLDAGPQPRPIVSFRGRGILLLQTLAVGLLVVAAYMAFLRPDGPGDLPRIEAPGGGGGQEGPQPPQADTAAGPGSRAARKGGAAAPGGTQDTAGGQAPAGVTPTTPTLDSAAKGGPTPADDQYADAVASIVGKAGTAAPAGG